MEKGGAQRPDGITALHLVSTTMKEEPFSPAALPLALPPLHTPSLATIPLVLLAGLGGFATHVNMAKVDSDHLPCCPTFPAWPLQEEVLLIP